jgi:hypothetical protein
MSMHISLEEFLMTETSIFYKRLEPLRIATLKAVITSRDELPPLFNRLQLVCGSFINGKPMAIFHGGAVQEGSLVEAAVPVQYPVESGDIHSRWLEAAPSLTAFHYGTYQTIRETILRLYEYQRKRPWSSSLIRREIYTVLDLNDPDKNVTEVQFLLHEWDRLLAQGVEKSLGAFVSKKVMQGIEAITSESSFDQYTAWIQQAIDRLDAATGDESIKCKAVSTCAHVFPQERIDHLRKIFQSGDIDDVLREMYRDDFWYEKPVRKGNVIHMRKNPYDPEAYAQAKTSSDRRRAYCHCPFVHPYLDGAYQAGEGQRPAALSPTFCYCGAGWYRRLWEGIIAKPVKIDYVATLLRGNHQCIFQIILPLEFSGEYAPES